MSLKYARISNVFGDSQPNSNLFSSLKKAATASDDFDMTFGKQVRDFVSINSVCNDLLESITNFNDELKHPLVFNICSGEGISIADFCAPSDKSMLQVEVYGSSEKPFDNSFVEIENKVISEIVQMGLAKNLESVGNVTYQLVPCANVICDLNKRNALDIIFSWLGNSGLEREKNDLDAVDEWGDNDDLKLGSLILAGRYGQWKYHWTDDCVLRDEKIGRIDLTVNPNVSA